MLSNAQISVPPLDFLSLLENPNLFKIHPTWFTIELGINFEFLSSLAEFGNLLPSSALRGTIRSVSH